MELLTGVIKDYAWGSRTALREVLGLTADGRPQAELWLGAHPAAPATAGGEPLDALVARDPGGVLGARVVERFGDRLPYLLKVLAAAAPLSVQAHPAQDQAREGFEAEERAGVPVDAPHRSYKDPHHKPELVVALTPFEALCGFRDPSAAVAALRRLDVPSAARLVELLSADDPERAVREAVSYLLSGAEEVEALVEDVSAACAEDVPADDDGSGAAAAGEPAPGGSAPLPEEMGGAEGGEAGAVGGRERMDEAPDEPVDGAVDPDRRTVAELAAHHPGDPGVLVALLLHRVRLEPGEALWLRPGLVHAYLSGTAVELMAASDNVLRGGLTTKHVDVAELQRVIDPRPVPVPRAEPSGDDGVLTWRPGPEELELSRLSPTGGGELEGPADGPRVVLCSQGHVELVGAGGTALRLDRGAGALVRDDDGPLRVAGDGVAWVAAVPR